MSLQVARAAGTLGHRGSEGQAEDTLLSLRSLEVSFRTKRGDVKAVRGVDLDVRQGEIVALVGESGSGKTTIGHALIRLLNPGEVRVSGTASFRLKTGQTTDLLTIPEQQMRHVRGDEIAMVFQEPMSSLNPVFTIGSQVVEAIRLHRGTSRRSAREETLELFAQLGFPSPRKCLDSYPHQISGGMRQRAMIAMALSCRPSLLIADESTTALDVTIQAQIIDLLRQQQERTAMAILFITHDLALVAEIAHRAAVLYAGQVVENAPVSELFANPRMPYTRALMEMIPRLGASAQPGYMLRPIPGQPASTLSIGSGCAFLPRCAFALPEPCEQPQVLESVGPCHTARCCRWASVGEKV